VNLFEFVIECAGDRDSPSFIAVHQVSSIEAIDIVAHRQDEIAAQMLDAIHRPSTST
jgi:hypothetical protein